MTSTCKCQTYNEFITEIRKVSFLLLSIFKSLLGGLRTLELLIYASHNEVSVVSDEVLKPIHATESYLMVSFIGLLKLT